MNKKILIYGGSSLISLELIKIYNNEEYEFIIFCRNKNKFIERLKELDLSINKFTIYESDLIELEKNLKIIVIKSVDGNKKNNLHISGLSLNLGHREVRVDGKIVENLTFTEFQILFLLCSHPGWVFTRYQIIEKIRGDNYPVTDRSVDFQIVGLRKKLLSAGKYIETVRGIGYRFKENL